MMKYFQRLGKSLMLPVAVLPATALLMGIGYYLDPVAWGGNSKAAAFFLTTGSAIIDKIPILFAVGVAFGMSEDNNGAAALSGLVAFLIITKLLSSGSITAITGVEADVAFSKIDNPFIGIVSGLVAAETYNRFHRVELPEFLAFFSGRRLVPIVTTLFMLVLSLVLYFVWPVMFSNLQKFGIKFAGLGSIGVGLFMFFNRLLIPLGLHHTLNAVFFFNLIGINDIGRFLGPAAEAYNNLPTELVGTYKVGMYQAGFYPIMMFGLPGAGLAMYLTSKPERRSETGSLMLAAVFAAFFTGVTEPLEFAFMFLAPALYLIHAVLSALSGIVVSYLGATAGFGFSAGLVDFLLSLKNPNASKPLLLLAIGVLFFIIYFALFYFVIITFKLKTPGREDEYVEAVKVASSENKFSVMAQTVLEAIGGLENVVSVDNCATRLRLEVNDADLVNEALVKASGAYGLTKVSKKAVQIIIGPKVELVSQEFKKLIK